MDTVFLHKKGTTAAELTEGNVAINMAHKMQPCPWCKAPAKLDQDCDTGWYVSCSLARCPVLPISAGYKFAHMAVMAWNCCGQTDQLPELMPVPTAKQLR